MTMKSLLLASCIALSSVGIAQAQDRNFSGLTGSITEDVNGNVEMNGVTLFYSGQVSGDLNMDGATLAAEAQVGGDVELNGAAISFEGRVEGHTEMNSGAIELDGEFLGPVQLKSGAVKLTGVYHQDLDLEGGQLELSGSYHGPVDIKLENRSGAFNRRDRSEAYLNGALNAGGYVCAHEVRLGPDLSVRGALTIEASELPSLSGITGSERITLIEKDDQGC